MKISANKNLVGGVVGNILETYDLSLFLFLIPQITNTFFVDGSKIDKTTIVYIVFLISMLVKLLGLIFFASIGDIYGRKKVLLISILGCGISTALIGLTPSSTSIGIFSFLLFTVFRITQGFFISNEYILSVIFLTEHAPRNKKGYYASWASFGFYFGCVIACFLSFLCETLIHKGIIPPWSWRILFILAALGSLFGYWIRRNCQETLAFIFYNSSTSLRKKSETIHDVITEIKKNKRTVLALININIFSVMSSSLIFFVAPFSIWKNINAHEITGTNTIIVALTSLSLLSCLILFFGKLSDKKDPMLMMVISTFFLLLLFYPYIYSLKYGSFNEILLMQSLIVLPCGILFSVAPRITVGIFSPEIRCIATGITYTTVTSITAGITPLLFSKLLMQYSIYISILFYAMVAFIGLISSCFLYFYSRSGSGIYALE